MQDACMSTSSLQFDKKMWDVFLFIILENRQGDVLEPGPL